MFKGQHLTSAGEEVQGMMRPQPGLSFSIVCDLGYAVGIVAHDVPRVGSLIWMAEPLFDEVPSTREVEEIKHWRWPVFFPLSAAIRRKLVMPIGMTAVPSELQDFPLLRSRDGRGGWIQVKFVNGTSRPVGPAASPAIPHYSVVNDTRLKEMIISGWRPEQEW
jgi:hypothetical protein